MAGSIHPRHPIIRGHRTARPTDPTNRRGGGERLSNDPEGGIHYSTMGYWGAAANARAITIAAKARRAGPSGQKGWPSPRMGQ